MNKTANQKLPVPYEYLHTGKLKTQYERIRQRTNSKSIHLLFQFEIDITQPAEEMIYLIGYFIWKTPKGRKSERLRNGILEIGDEFKKLAVPLGLGNIYVPDNIFQKWVKTGKIVKLEPIAHKNPHLGYTDSTASLYPSPPATVSY